MGGSKQIENHWSRLEHNSWDEPDLEERPERASPKLGASSGLMDLEPGFRWPPWGTPSLLGGRMCWALCVGRIARRKLLWRMLIVPFVVEMPQLFMALGLTLESEMNRLEGEIPGEPGEMRGWGGRRETKNLSGDGSGLPGHAS